MSTLSFRLRHCGNVERCDVEFRNLLLALQKKWHKFAFESDKKFLINNWQLLKCVDWRFCWMSWTQKSRRCKRCWCEQRQCCLVAIETLSWAKPSTHSERQCCPLRLRLTNRVLVFTQWILSVVCCAVHVIMSEEVRKLSHFSSSHFVIFGTLHCIQQSFVVFCLRFLWFFSLLLHWHLQWVCVHIVALADVPEICWWFLLLLLLLETILL